MSGHVFISYSRSDGSERAFEMANRLRGGGCDVWIDQRSIPLTVPWMAEIRSGIWGALVVVVIDTPGWRASENCQAEYLIARGCSVQIITVANDQDLNAVSAGMLEANKSMPEDERTRSELFERSDQWASLGRPQRALASGRTLAKYRGFLRCRSTTRLPTGVSSYVSASGRRQRRRRTLRQVGSLVAVALVLGGVAIYNGLGQAQQRIDSAIQSFSGSQNFAAAWSDGPYQHLQLLAHTESKGSVVRAEFARAFGAALPDWAGTQPPSPEREHEFAKSRTPRAVSPSGLVAQIDAIRRTVTVTRMGTLYRTIALTGPTPVMAWSRADEWLMVGDGPDLVAYDVQFGGDSVRVRGGAGDVIGLVVGDDDEMIVRTSTGRTIRWPSPFGRRIATDERVFADAVAIPNSGQALVLSGSGVLRTVEIGAARVSDTVRLPVGPDATTRALAVAPDGRTAFVTTVDSITGQAGVLAVGLVDHRTRSLPLTECVPYDIAVPGSTVAYLACGTAGVGVLSLRSGKFTVVKLRYEARTMSVAATPGRLFVGTHVGLILSVDPESMAVISEGGTGCAHAVESLTVTADGVLLFHGGDAAGNFGCGARGDYSTYDEPRWNRLAYLWQSVDRVASVALSADDRFVAFGFADGSVRVFTAHTLEPIAILRPTTGSVRGLAFGQTSGQLLAVTASGACQDVCVRT